MVRSFDSFFGLRECEVYDTSAKLHAKIILANETYLTGDQIFT